MRQKPRTRSLLVAGLGAFLAAATFVGSGGPAVAAAAEVDFVHTGAAQSFSVPAGACSITVTASGAEGGVSEYGGTPGKGATVVATLAVTPGETLEVVVGGEGGDGEGAPGAGGFGGGGDGGDRYSPEVAGGGGGGGGASYVRRGTTPLIVAAGGGGSAGYAGGDGGELGEDGLPQGLGVGAVSGGLAGGDTTSPGAGGVGGAGAANGEDGTDGSALQGGDGGDGAYLDGPGSGGGGGGGGFVGGGGGGGGAPSFAGGAGGGGSSFGPAGTVFTDGARTGDGVVSITYTSDSCPPAEDTPPAEAAPPAEAVVTVARFTG